MTTFKPHPPPLPEWPDHVKEMYYRGCDKIDRLRGANYDADGTVRIPFVCYGCEERRGDFAMLTGEGLPLCIKCLGFDPATLEDV